MYFTQMVVLDTGDMLLISCSDMTQSAARPVLLQNVEAMVEKILRKKKGFFFLIISFNW